MLRGLGITECIRQLQLYDQYCDFYGWFRKTSTQDIRHNGTFCRSLSRFDSPHRLPILLWSREGRFFTAEDGLFHLCGDRVQHLRNVFEV